MTARKAYSNTASSGRMLPNLIRCFTFSILLSICLYPMQIQAQDLPEYDEIAVFLEIPRVGGIEIFCNADIPYIIMPKIENYCIRPGCYNNTHCTVSQQGSFKEIYCRVVIRNRVKFCPFKRVESSLRITLFSAKKQ